MQKKKYIYIIFLMFLFLFGCSAKTADIIAPPDDMSLDEATKINLKALDLDKLSKNDIFEIDGINLKNYGTGYEMEYRYPQEPITIKIVKFTSKEKLQSFWENWLAVHNLEEYKEINHVKFSLNEINRPENAYAWQKGQWFTYIGVPVETPESEPLRDKVKDLVSNHYLNLAKRDVSEIK